MENKVSVITETAWNLYRAFRTYDGPKKRIEDARAVVPERGRVYRYPVVNEDGTQDANATYETTRQPIEHWPAGISHARAIVLSFNLDEPTTDEAFNKWGIHVLTECIAHEIEHGTEATKKQCERWYTGDEEKDFIRYNDATLTPFIGGLHDFSAETYTPTLYPYITLNLSVYESREDFIKHMVSVLPDMYDRLDFSRRRAVEAYETASALAEEEWERQAQPSNTPRAVSHIVKERGAEALFSHLDPDIWREWEAEKQKYKEERDVEVPQYHESTPAWNPDSGLTEEEWRFYWHFCTLDEDGTCRVCLPHVHLSSEPVAAPTRLLRGRYLGNKRPNLNAFHLHAGWWTAVCVDGQKPYGMAKATGVSRSTISRAIVRLEEEFMLRKKKDVAV